MKKIVKVLISRLFITVLLILLQFGYLFYLLLEVGKMSTYINLILNILAFIVALFVVNRRMNPAYRLAWVFIILMFPLLGLLLYVVFGRPELTRKAREKMNRVNEAENGWQKKIRLPLDSLHISVTGRIFRFMNIQQQIIIRPEKKCFRLC